MLFSASVAALAALALPTVLSSVVPQTVIVAPMGARPLPLVVWHGLSDSYDASGLKSVMDLAERVNPGTYTYAIRLSNDSSADRRATFFGNVTTQVSDVCSELASHPVLSRAPAINALGFSQGGQFLRAYVQKCNDPPVRNLVTFGAQHNGIAEFQKCAPVDLLCKAAISVARKSVWTQFSQNGLVPAQYYRSPEDLPSYLNYSNFLADINNERQDKNETYARNLASLKKFVMVVFGKDKTVVPRESGHFAEVNVTSKRVTPLRERKIYKEDWLGLRALDEKDGLAFREVDGEHMELNDEVLEEVFAEYFAP